jgi:hypothetical protein
VQVLLDSGSDGDLVFVNKDKPMLLPFSKRLVPQSWNTSNGIFQTKRKAKVELNFFDYSDSKRYYSEPDVVEYNKDSKPQYDLILGNETMKELGIVLDFKSRGRLYGTKMETNVFDFTLFFSSASLFPRYDILQVPLNLGSRESAFFCKIY